MDRRIFLSSVFTLILFLNHSLQSGAVSVESRDAETVSLLKKKLDTLQELLSDMDSEEDDLKQVAREQDDAIEKKKKSVVSEDMLARIQTLDKRNKDEDNFAAGGKLSDPNESLQILSKALARLRKPTYNREDSTGESMGSQNNENEDDEDTEEMAKFIEGALAKLQQERAPQVLDQTSRKQNIIEEGTFGDFVDRDDNHNHHRYDTGERNRELREEAIKAVETRLMHDIRLANSLGISVDDLIRHLRAMENQDAQIRMLDKQLSILSDSYKK